MPWQPLGTVPINFDWQALPQLLVAAEVFRITQSWEGMWPGEGRILLRFEYDGSTYGTYRSVFPSKETDVIEIPIPDAFRRAGMISRRLSVKRSQRSKVFYDSNWEAAIEAFLEDSQDYAPGQILDGGIY
jgi:hypothetical protein